MLFGSLEHLREVQRRANADPKFRALADGLKFSCRLVLEPEPSAGITRRIAVGFKVEDSQLSQVREGNHRADIVLEAPYGLWADISAGRLDDTLKQAAGVIQTAFRISARDSPVSARWSYETGTSRAHLGIDIQPDRAELILSGRYDDGRYYNRHLVLHGRVAELASALGAAGHLVEIIRTVPAEFEGSYASYSKAHCQSSTLQRKGRDLVNALLHLLRAK
jgi:hypothetical protein